MIRSSASISVLLVAPTFAFYALIVPAACATARPRNRCLTTLTLTWFACAPRRLGLTIGAPVIRQWRYAEGTPGFATLPIPIAGNEQEDLATDERLQDAFANTPGLLGDKPISFAKDGMFGKVQKFPAESFKVLLPRRGACADNSSEVVSIIDRLVAANWLGNETAAVMFDASIDARELDVLITVQAFARFHPEGATDQTYVGRHTHNAFLGRVLLRTQTHRESNVSVRRTMPCLLLHIAMQRLAGFV